MPRHDEKSSGNIDLLQGTLDMLILKVAALRPIHGYALVQRIQQISRDVLQIRQGSLYPALYKLENKGWLKSEWKTTEGGREAKFYSLTKKECRDERALEWFDRLLRDFRYAFRSLSKSPGYTLTVILTLASGIGANTAIFSLLQGVVFAPLPYRASDRLVVVWQTNRLP